MPAKFRLTVLMTAVACWHLGMAPLNAEEPSPTSVWVYSDLQRKIRESLKDEKLAPQTLEEWGFFRDAASFPAELLRDAPSVTTPLSEVLRALHYSSHQSSLRAVVEHLKNHQPRTFGTDLVAALLDKNARSKTRKFVLDHGKELAQVRPGSVEGMLILLREALPGLDDPETEGALQANLRPLKDQEDKQVVEACDQFFEVKNWTQANTNLNAYMARTAGLLRLLSRRDPIETRHVFDHGLGVVRDAIRAETQKYPGENSYERSYLNSWYRECSTIPMLLPLIMRLVSEEPALRQDLDLEGQIMWWSTESRRMADPAYVRDMFEAMSFLKSAPEFRAHKISGQNKGTFYGEAMERLSNYSDARTGADGLRSFIAKINPPTFGSSLTLVMLQNGRKDAGLLSFIKDHSGELNQLSPQTREEMAILVRNEVPDFFKPGVLDAELRKAAAPLLEIDQKLSQQRVTDIMTASDIAGTRLSETDFTKQTPILLQSLADSDLPTARKLFAKVIRLILDGDTQQKYTGPASYSPAGRWLSNTHSSPQLYPEVMAEAKRLDLLETGEHNWFVNYAQGLTARRNLTDASRVAAFLEVSPLLKEATDFDAVSVVNQHYYFQTVAEMLADTLRSTFAEKKVPPAVREYLAKRTPHTFGSDLMLALLDDDPVAATANFAITHESDWQKIEAGQRRLALAGLYRPIMARLEAAHHPSTAEVKRVLQPLWEEESKFQRKFLEQLLQGQVLNERSEQYIFHRPLTWLLEWMQSTGEGDAPAALAKACKLFRDGAQELSNGDKKPSSSALARLLIQLAHSPRLQTLVMNEAAAWNLAIDPKFLHEVHSALLHTEVFWIGQTTAAAMLRSTPFLNDATHFDAQLFHDPKPTSELESFVSYLRSPWRLYLRPQTQAWLAKEPEGFGRDLLLAAMDEAPAEKFPAFQKARADDLAKLPAEQRRAIERLSERLMTSKKK